MDHCIHKTPLYNFLFWAAKYFYANILLKQLKSNKKKLNKSKSLTKTMINPFNQRWDHL